MRSYLSLIPISAKVHRRQNRMTLLCIIFAVFLVTAIFSMVDLMVRCETEHSKENHGFWHIAIQNLSEEGAGEIRSRGDVAAASWYDVVNMDQSRAYEVDGIQTALCGIEESFRTDIMSYFPADSSIQANDAAILTPNARELLGVDVGESITLRTPAGEYSFQITGFRIDDSRYATKNGTGEVTALLVKGEQIGIFMNISTFRQITIPYALAEEIREIPGVRHAFGRMYREDIPASFPVETAETTVDLISYDALQLGWLLEDDLLRKGSDLERVYGNSDAVLCIWDQDVPLTIGDTVTVGDSQVEIAGMLTHSPFSNSGQTNGEIILICSEETFTRLTGVEGYAILDVQVTKSATDEEVASIEELAGDQYSFTDRRDESDRSTFWAFSLFIYGFLAIIALITVLNIVNSISMSVSARIKQYGAMRAVGMGGRQLTRMIAAEAATYAFTGCIVGCAAGLPLSRLLYNRLITTNFPYYTWSIPVPALLVILLFVIGATIISVHAPAKRIRGMSITDTINEL